MSKRKLTMKNRRFFEWELDNKLKIKINFKKVSEDGNGIYQINRDKRIIQPGSNFETTVKSRKFCKRKSYDYRSSFDSGRMPASPYS